MLNLYLLFGLFSSVGQESEVVFYIQIDDEVILPETAKVKSSPYLKLSGKTADSDKIYKKFDKVKKFEKAFPSAVTESLKNVYMVVCSNADLGSDLKNKFQRKISRLEYIGVPEETSDYANDLELALEQTNLFLIKADSVWKYIHDLPKVPVAITDTYFDLNHEDLSMTLVGGTNYFEHYHGTCVAGCVSAVTNNGIGLASIGYNTSLEVSSNRSDYEVLRLAQAGYRVINCSWESPNCGYSSVQAEVYDEIRNIWDAVVVFGAGNEGSKHCGNNKPAYPGSYESNIDVTSIGHYHAYGDIDHMTNWEDVHENILGDSLSAHKHHSTIDICAPGYRVSTTDLTGEGLNGSNYTFAWGTSFAAPQVSGTLGLIFSINPCLSADEAVDILLNTSDSNIYNLPENAQYIGRLGTGRLDVNAAVLGAIESATEYLSNITLSGSEVVESNYAIKCTDNVLISSGADVDFITRKEVFIEKNFEVELGAEFSIDVDVNNSISCN